MTQKTFSIDLRPNGEARLALSFRAVDRAGIQRLACDIAAADLVRLALFAETLALQEVIGAGIDADLDLDGLHIATDDTGRRIRLVRRQGYNVQEAHMDRSDFASEMSGITETCLARAAEGKHGPVLAEMLETTQMPSSIARSFGEDRADQVFHAVREMALLILCEEAETKGSELARKLRSKTRREEAREDVRVALGVLSSAFLSPAGEHRPEAGMRRRG